MALGRGRVDGGRGIRVLQGESALGVSRSGQRHPVAQYVRASVVVCWNRGPMRCAFRPGGGDSGRDPWGAHRMDGKQPRRSHDRAEGFGALFAVSAWASADRANG